MGRATPLDHFRQSVTVIAALGNFTLPQIPFIFDVGKQIGTNPGASADAVPPGWAFVIWGPIFAWTILFAIWQALPGKGRSSFLRHIGWPAALTLALSCLWSALAVFAPDWTTLPVMIALFAAHAFLARVLLNRPESDVEAARWLAIYPFQFFFGWITLALMANLASVRLQYGLDPLGVADHVYTLVIMVAGAALVVTGLILTRAAVFYMLAVGWGIVALLFLHAWADWNPVPAAGSAGLLLILLAVERWVSLSNRPRPRFAR